MKQGIFVSVSASLLFAIVYYFSTVLEPLTGVEVFSWRIVMGLPALAILIQQLKGWPEIGQVGKRLVTDFRFFLWTVISATLFGIQTWLFVWAPIHHMALDVSLGYFLLPLVMVLIGRIVYKEKLSWLQWLAVGFAAVGVLHEFWRINSFSWATALVAFGYPPYFMVRRYLRVGALASLWFDFTILLLPTLYVLFTQDISLISRFIDAPRFFWQVPLFGLLSSIALVSYLKASRLLPLGIFGLLGYVEPILLFWVAFLLLDEPIVTQQWWTYYPIWMAVALMTLEGIWRLYKDWRSGRLSRQIARVNQNVD